MRGLGSRMMNRTSTQGEAQSDEPMFDSGALGIIEDRMNALEISINSLKIQTKSAEEKLKLECRELKLNKYDYTTGKELRQLVDKLSSRIEDQDKALKT